MRTRLDIHERRAQLERELRELEKEDLRLRDTEDDDRAAECLAKAELLLPLVSHTKDCSDHRPNLVTRKGSPRCLRCYLKNVVKEEWCPALSEFRIDIVLNERY